MIIARWCIRWLHGITMLEIYSWARPIRNAFLKSLLHNSGMMDLNLYASLTLSQHLLGCRTTKTVKKIRPHHVRVYVCAVSKETLTSVVVISLATVMATAPQRFTEAQCDLGRVSRVRSWQLGGQYRWTQSTLSGVVSTVVRCKHFCLFSVAIKYKLLRLEFF